MLRRTRFALLLAVIFAAPKMPANALVLSPEQRHQLDRGEVIVLDVLPPGGTGQGEGGTAMAVVQASPDTVWQVLVDYPRHRGLYPRVVAVQVLESDAEHTVVRYVVGVGPFSFGFHVANYPDTTRRRIEWQLDHARPNDLFRDSWGYWQVEPHGSGVMLTYAMGARTVLPAFLTRSSERQGLIETVRAVRERAEQLP
jgi:ribosome-associated toxin RatA of RatAB toxin-antitoxin module